MSWCQIDRFSLCLTINIDETQAERRLKGDGIQKEKRMKNHLCEDNGLGFIKNFQSNQISCKDILPHLTCPCKENLLQWVTT